MQRTVSGGGPSPTAEYIPATGDARDPFALGRDSYVGQAKLGKPVHRLHVHQGAELGLVSAGQCDFYYEGRRYALGPGDAVFVDAMLPHGAGRRVRGEFTYDWLHVSFEALLGVPPARAGLALVQACRRDRGGELQVLHTSDEQRALIEDAIRLYERGNSTDLAGAWGKAVQLIATLIPKDAKRMVKSDPQHADASLAAVAVIHHRYTEALTLQELADHCSLSVSRLVHVFSSAMNHSPIEYRNVLRIDKAKELLLGSDDKIESISADVGFEHPGHFYRLFRRLTGVTPTQFRKEGLVLG